MRSILVRLEVASVRIRSQCIKSLKKRNHLRSQLFPFCFHRMPKHCYKSKYLNLRLLIFVMNYELQILSANLNANNQYLWFRITEASKGFQMEKIEDGYENMNQFTVNLSREEKIIREIYFDRGMSFISPKLLFKIATVCNLHDDTK